MTIYIYPLLTVVAVLQPLDHWSYDGETVDNKQTLVKWLKKVELNLNVAKMYVRSYKTQRALENSHMSLAKSDVTNKVPLRYCHKVITLDMGQNLGLQNCCIIFTFDCVTFWCGR